MKKTTIISKMERNGQLMRRAEAGWIKVKAAPPLPNHPADSPAYDPDNPPMTLADLAKRKRVPRVKTLRRALMLTQEEFAARYHIPVGTLRDWEQGRTEPDAPARALLKLIAADPEGAAKKLAVRRELSAPSPH